MLRPMQVRYAVSSYRNNTGVLHDDTQYSSTHKELEYLEQLKLEIFQVSVLRVNVLL